MLLDGHAAEQQRLTALMHSFRKGHVEIARMLLDAVAKQDLVSDNYGITALTAASCHGRVESVRLLLNAGADKPGKPGWQHGPDGRFSQRPH